MRDLLVQRDLRTFDLDDEVARLLGDDLHFSAGDKAEILEMMEHIALFANLDDGARLTRFMKVSASAP